MKLRPTDYLTIFTVLVSAAGTVYGLSTGDWWFAFILIMVGIPSDLAVYRRVRERGQS